MDDSVESPKAYFLRRLLERGLRFEPRAFNSPLSQVHCVALNYRTEDELPVMYDKDLLGLLYAGDLDRVKTRLFSSGEHSHRVVNAQNANGETVLMKVCRRALTSKAPGHRHIVDVVSLLLNAGANPSVCCDSGKNVLHDIFWTAKPPPPQTLKVMEALVELLSDAAGKIGIIDLMLSQDKHGYTPLDYVIPLQQPNWRRLFDRVINWCADDGVEDEDQDRSVVDQGDGGVVFGEENEAEERKDEPPLAEQHVQQEVVPLEELATGDTRRGPDDGDSPPQPPPPPQQSTGSPSSRLRLLELETSNRALVRSVIADAYPDDQRLLAQLCSASASFLMSDCSDPDAIIVAVSPNFITATGYSADEVLGRNCRFLQGPGTSTKQVDAIRRALAHNATVRVSLLNYRKTGESFMNNFLLTPLRSRSTGHVAFFLGIQNCPEALVQDRRKRLRGSGADWIDDDDDDDDQGDDQAHQGNDDGHHRADQDQDRADQDDDEDEDQDDEDDEDDDQDDDDDEGGGATTPSDSRTLGCRGAKVEEAHDEEEAVAPTSLPRRKDSQERLSLATDDADRIGGPLVRSAASSTDTLAAFDASGFDAATTPTPPKRKVASRHLDANSFDYLAGPPPCENKRSRIRRSPTHLYAANAGLYDEHNKSSTKAHSPARLSEGCTVS